MNDVINLFVPQNFQCREVFAVRVDWLVSINIYLFLWLQMNTINDIPLNLISYFLIVYFEISDNKNIHKLYYNNMPYLLSNRVVIDLI